MDSFELNKIFGAVLGTLVFVMGVGFVAEAIYAPIEGRGPGYALVEAELPSADAVAEEEEPAVPLGVLLASANVDQGASAVRKCQSCHNFGEGEPNKQGPGLYDVVARPIAGHEGFAYSDILSEMGSAGEIWSYEHLDAFIASPKGFAPGTKMAFAGVKSPEERANILAYLQTLSSNPIPFPEAEAAPAEEETAAEDEAEPTEDEAVAEDAAPAEDEAPAGDEAAPAADDAVAVEGDATGTPTVTQSETQVQGTPTTSAPGDIDPAGEAAPAEEEAASAGEVVPMAPAEGATPAGEMTPAQ